jgi:hypothetical protein
MRWGMVMGVIGSGLLLQLAGAQPPATTDATVRLNLDELNFLAGQWAGTLEYLDYKDGSTKYKIQASLDCKKSDGGLEYKFSYVEPNGKKVDGTAIKLTLHDGGAELRFSDERWRVVGKTVDATSGKREVIVARIGTDNEKPAQLRRIITLDKETLAIRTEVTPEKADKALVRNEYLLKKK